MNFKTIGLLLLLLSSIKGFSQLNLSVNPENNWFFGAEIGTNAITTIHPDHKIYLQGGLLAEYYFAKNWSLSGRIKYFKTGITDQLEVGERKFEGEVISIPFNITWYYRFVNNFTGNFKIGVAYNQEVKSEYSYPENERTDYSKFYGNFNPGFGLNYFVSPKTAIYINYEVFVLGSDKKERGLFDFLSNSANNNLFNIGIKHSFSNKNKIGGSKL